MIDLFAWLAIIILAGAYLLVSQIMNMLLIQEQVIGFIWLIGILAFLVLTLLTVACPPKTDPHVKLEWWINGLAPFFGPF